jgi:hypothetical protein
MSHLLFLSITSLGVLALGCSGPDCGPGGAFEFGLTVSSDQVSLVFGDLVAGANNDCPDPAAPAGVISLTIMGAEMGSTGIITFCVPRPDLLQTMALPIGSSGVKVIDLNATDASCSYTFDASHLPTGTATSTGMCGNGSDKAGFALVFDGFVGLKRTCGATMDTVNVGLTGTVAVTAS